MKNNFPNTTNQKTKFARDIAYVDHIYVKHERSYAQDKGDMT